MVIYSTTLVRAGLEAAIANAEPSPEGWYFPSELYTNAGQALRRCRVQHDGPSPARHRRRIDHHPAPSTLDLASPEVGDDVRKYMRTMEASTATTARGCSTLSAISARTPTAAGSW